MFISIYQEFENEKPKSFRCELLIVFKKNKPDIKSGPSTSREGLYKHFISANVKKFFSKIGVSSDEEN